MAIERSARPLARCLRCTRNAHPRAFSASATSRLDTQPTPSESESAARPPPPPSDIPKARRDPNTVSTPAAERQLFRDQKIHPIGSRRRRAAIASTGTIPFSQLPYQCFQEARAFLQEDRKEKVQLVEQQRERIAKLKAKEVAPQDEAHKELRLESMKTRLAELKVMADINDPVVKRKFEDGEGDMTKPIYRYLADKKWRSYKREVLLQRIHQMNIIPDVLPVLDPIVSTKLTFAGKKVQHGDVVSSLTSAKPPTLNTQAYEQGTKLYTIAVVNSDVPNVEKDGYEYRCHFLACNIPLSPTNTLVPFDRLKADQVILPWLPPYAQKGLPYQRMSIIILAQPPVERTENSPSQPLDVAGIKDAGRYAERRNFIMKSFADRFALKPVGVDLFRTVWDEFTADVMRRAGVPGWDVEFKRKRVEPLPYQRKGSERYR